MSPPISQLLVCAAAGTTLAVLFTFAIARVVTDPVEDTRDEEADGPDPYVARLASSSFHAAGNSKQGSRDHV